MTDAKKDRREETLCARYICDERVYDGAQHPSSHQKMVGVIISSHDWCGAILRCRPRSNNSVLDSVSVIKFIKNLKITPLIDEFFTLLKN